MTKLQIDAAVVQQALDDLDMYSCGVAASIKLLEGVLQQPEQQAQAGEPEVVAWRYYLQDGQGPLHHAQEENAKMFSYDGTAEPLITMKSHREALAKKDEALKACVAALKEWKRVDELGREPDVHWESIRDMRRARDTQHEAAITKAQEQLK